MAYGFIDITPSTGADAMYQFKTLLVAQGWVVLSSGDGLAAYSAVSDVITSGNSGANGWANNGAWVRITSPDAQIEFTMQRGFSNSVWRVKYSRNDKFTQNQDGGASPPDASHTPYATDQQILAGAGTDAVPSYTYSLLGSDGQYRFKAGADDASPYTFYWVTNVVGTASTSHCWLLDACTQLDPADAEPYVHYIANSGALFYAQLESTSVGPLSFYPSAAPSVFGRYPCLTLEATNVVFPTASGSNPITKKDDLAAIWVGRRAATQTYPGYKGKLTMMRWSGTARSSCTPVSEVTASDLISFGDVVLPWGGTLPTV